MLRKTDLPATTPMLKLFNIKNIHIEISSKCTLKCPRCPRTEIKPEELNQEISFKEFQQSFTVSFLSNVEKIIFCGDIGDPIYATEFLDIVRYIKENSNVSLTIVTNGSYKTPEWWKELGQLLTQHDQVTFSVDGWNQETNEKYRVNCNFDSIIAGAKSLRVSSKVSMVWSMIYFNFNFDTNRIQALAKEIGFNYIDFVKSSKFDGRYLINGVDDLKPLDLNFTAKNLQYEKNRLPLDPLPISWSTQVNRNAHPWARCLRHEKEMFVSVNGLVSPCPWFNTKYQENKFIEKHHLKMNIKTRTLEEILSDPLWDEFLDDLNTNPLEICIIKCQQCQ